MTKKGIVAWFLPGVVPGTFGPIDMKDEKSPFPGVSAGALENFAAGGELYDPSKEKPKDVRANLERIAAYMARPDFSYPSVEGKLTEMGMEWYKQAELVERAYLVSEAFRQRAVRSLGYERLEDMTPEHRKQYDFIVQRGDMSAEHLFVKTRKDRNEFISPQNTLEALEKGIEENKDDPAKLMKLQGVKNSVTDVLEGRKPQEGDGYAVFDPDTLFWAVPWGVAHEMAHYVYNKDEVNPGKYGKVTGYTGEKVQYGKDDSPLDRIDQDEIRLTTKYVARAFDMSQMSAKRLLNGCSQESISFLKRRDIHDNAGFERAADIHSIRMDLFMSGKMNMFNPDDRVKKETIQEKRKYEPYLRIFQHWDDEKSAEFLNDVAQEGNLKETVGKNILAAIEEDDRDKTLNAGNGVTTSAAAEMAASSFQRICENIGNGQQESRGLSV